MTGQEISLHLPHGKEPLLQDKVPALGETVRQKKKNPKDTLELHEHPLSALICIERLFACLIVGCNSYSQ